MATKILPYMNVPGSISKILEKIKTAETPDTFNGDFLSTVLGFKGGNYRTFISWAKKAGLLTTDGKPTPLYKQYRNPTNSKTSLATALKNAYSDLYLRNEYAHALEKKALKGLIIEATGESEDSGMVDFITNTFWNVKELADFKSKPVEGVEESNGKKTTDDREEKHSSETGIKLGLNYTINLVLPKTEDVAVYNAIFKSLKENLLK